MLSNQRQHEEQTRKVIQEVSCDINFTLLSHYCPELSPTMNRVTSFLDVLCLVEVSIQLERGNQEVQRDYLWSMLYLIKEVCRSSVALK